MELLTCYGLVYCQLAVLVSQFRLLTLHLELSLQLALILGVLHTIATDSIAMHRLQVRLMSCNRHVL